MYKLTTILLVLCLVAFSNAQYSNSNWTFTFGTYSTTSNVRIERSLKHVALQTSTIKFGPIGGTASVWVNDAIKSTTLLPNPEFNPVDYVMGFTTIQVWENGSCFPKVYEVRCVLSYGSIFIHNMDGTALNINMAPTTVVQVDALSMNWIL